jgi:predicted molibdopterin-dependent oxidoreductase YjgC
MNIANLALICGKVGREGCGINPLRSGANLQGICDMGVLPAHYTAYQRITNKETVKKFGAAWGETLPEEPGISILEPMTAWKGLFVMGEDIISRADDKTDEVVKMIDGLDLLVVQDAFLTETAKLADVVLPSCTYAEKEGTVTNTERRVQRIRKAIPMHEGTKADWQILSELLALFGKKGDYASAEEIFEEIRTVTPSYAGINYARLDAEGTLQWPCPTESHPGTPILHTEGFGRGEKALVVSVE